MTLPTAAIGAGSAIPMVANDFAQATQPFLPVEQIVVTATEDTPVEVANTAVTANSNILVTLKTVGGTVGARPTIPTITPGTGFTFVADSGDTSDYNVLIIG